MPMQGLKFLVPAGNVVLFLSSIASATDLTTELIDCRRLSPPEARLGCYDQLADAGTEADSEPRLSQQDLFRKDETEIRKSIEAATGSEVIKQIEATIAELRKTSSG